MSGGMIAIVATLFLGSSIIGMLIGRKMFSTLSNSKADTDEKKSWGIGGASSWRYISIKLVIMKLIRWG